MGRDFRLGFNPDLTTDRYSYLVFARMLRLLLRMMPPRLAAEC